MNSTTSLPATSLPTFEKNCALWLPTTLSLQVCFYLFIYLFIVIIFFLGHFGALETQENDNFIWKAIIF